MNRNNQSQPGSRNCQVRFLLPLTAILIVVFAMWGGSALLISEDNNRGAPSSATVSAELPIPSTIAQPVNRATIVNADWLNAVQAEISQAEYQVTWQDDTAVSGQSGAYQAPNRAQNFRTYFTESSIHLQPRLEENAEWSWGLTLIGYGYEGYLQSPAPAQLVVHENRTEYHRGAVTEWYINDENGLEQGFTIDAPPEIDVNIKTAVSPPLIIALNVTADLTPKMADSNDAIDFYDAVGKRTVRYSKLIAYDADKKLLPAEIRLTNCNAESTQTDCVLQLVVDDTGAHYPIVVDPLADWPDWSVGIDQAKADFGFSVAAAGDVNNDGYDDVMIGAPRYDNGQKNEGAAFIFYGSADGLSISSDWSAEGDQKKAYFGYALSGVGDVNQDGYDDVVIGAPYFNGSETDSGAVFAYYGSDTGLSIDADWQVEGAQAGDYLGYSISSAGDIDSDNDNEILIGAPGHDVNDVDEGRVVLYFGGPTGLSGTADLTIEGDQSGAQLGHAVASAGDTNNDGHDDIIVGAPFFDDGATDAGQAAIYYGAANGLDIAGALVTTGGSGGAQFGFAVGAAGDVNGDGYSDVIVGAPGYDNGADGKGRALIYYGAAAGVSTSPNWTVQSDAPGVLFGRAVAAAGDVNNDGFGDVMVAVPRDEAAEDGDGRQQVLVYYGAAGGMSQFADWIAESDAAKRAYNVAIAGAGDINGDGYDDIVIGLPFYEKIGVAVSYFGAADGLNTIADWSGESDQEGARFGRAVASAGDVNGDGYADIIISAPEYDNGNEDAGRVYVYHGSPDGFGSSADWIADGDQAEAFFGQAIDTAGDVNGDGYADILIGAPEYDNSETNAGRVVLYYGSAAGLSAVPTWQIEGTQAEELVGAAVAYAGDINNDGFADVIIGSPRYDGALNNQGLASVFYGAGSGLNNAADWIFSSDKRGGRAGVAVGTAGDVNGDGYDDIIIGARKTSAGRGGVALVFYGSNVGLGGAMADWTAVGDTGSRFGHALETAGDINGDGFDDVIIGAYRYTNNYAREGAVYVYLGAGAGLETNYIWMKEGGQKGAWLGRSVRSAGNINGDSYDDVVIGAPGYQNDEQKEGRAYLYHGVASGLGEIPEGIIENNQPGSRLGYGVDTAGDVNGDGFADVIVGAPNYDHGETNEGIVYLFYGAGEGITPPKAGFWATPLTGSVPLTVAFTNTSTNAASFTWDFGDSTIATVASPTHVYTTSGVYTATLTAVGPGGQDTLVRAEYITVEPPERIWQAVSTAQSPPVIGEYAMAYDENRDALVLYGGNAAGWPYESSTWEFNGADWTPVTTATQRPNAVYGIDMVFDGNHALLFGGSDATDTTLAETWSFDGLNWTQATPSVAPPARANHAMIYDANNGRILMFGGQNETAYYDDFWQYDSHNWSLVTAVGPAPPPRAWHGMAYDADNSLVYLFGGRSPAGDLLADLWSFNAVTNEWTEITVPGPSARQAASLIYDPARGDLILVGGVTEHGDAVLNDTWHYRDAGWVEAVPLPLTPGAAYHRLVYDQAEQAIVLFANGETWRYK